MSGVNRCMFKIVVIY